ncbi:MAG TPA: histone deacetylase family protein [Aliidongia sp.]|uniref:histone deacetylase family protein n=1 Tax=Aliidongia sp. TaxID=1914230 RepID=UPI002DDD2482|nr:histone deacetylase family protein [Aliidongia sp.]HEV2677256.1 histone deacetylase family protein [Aliidongia sp.]
MTTLLYTHSTCIGHDPGPGHPESPARLQAIWTALEAPAFAGLIRREAPLATREALERVHPAAHIDRLLAAVPATGFAALDADTFLSPGSGEAAFRSAGAITAAIDAVVAGEAKNAFCAVRPPGHHAEPTTAMGFCLFSNAVVGALHARAVHGLRRVAIVDFDVHHGNGSQVVAERDADLFYASTHQSPLYPGTGAARETGLGNIVNRPLRAGAGTEEFRTAFGEWIMPALGQFAPDLVIVSAGFDAHADDPLAGLTLTEADFVWVTEQLLGFAERYCHGRLVSTLEGGYDLKALAASTAAHVTALMAA